MSKHAEILMRFMRGEIEATDAVSQIKALPREELSEYVLWPEGAFTPEHMQAKIAELQAAWGPESAGPAA